MLSATLGKREGLKILCLGAHCDDIEIGCGGTIIKMSEEYSIEEAKWCVFTSTPERYVEAEKCAAQFLKKVNKKEVVIEKYRDGFLPYQSESLKKIFEELKKFRPDVIFTHYRDDRHQDHRVVSDLTWNTFRDHLIFEYEIPKYDGDIGNPNCFVPLEKATADSKVQTIVDYFPSQSSKHWFDRETFYALMRLRGMESASRVKYAEAFYLRKCIL